MVVAPPRPPRASIRDPGSLVIEDARERQRRRHRVIAVCLLAALGLGLGLGIWQGGGGPGRSGSGSDRPPSSPPTRAREQQQIARAARTSLVGAAKPLGAGRGWAMNGLALYWTSDDGRTWRTVTPPGIGDVIARVADVDAVDDRHLWVSASDIPGDRDVHGSIRHPEILRTTDGGRTWRAVIPPGCYGCGGSHLSFLDARHGFALNGFPNRLYATADGGATWRLVASTPFSGALTFVTSREAWGVSDPTGSVGSDERPVGGGKLFRTTDGGQTWRPVQLRPPAAYAHDASVAELPQFFGTRNGVVAVCYRDPGAGAQHLVVYVTADGGRTWSGHVGPEIGRPQWGLAGILPFSAADVRDWFLFLGPRLDTTTDGGRSWTVVRPVFAPRAADIFDVTFTSPRSGWAVFDTGQGPALVHTTDGGRNWTPLSPPVRVR